MKKVRITAIRKACYPDLMAKYENPIQHACDVQEGQVWIANGWAKPDGFCDNAWDSISAFVMTLAHGGRNIYDGWMKNPKGDQLRHDLKGFKRKTLEQIADKADPKLEPARLAPSSVNSQPWYFTHEGDTIHVYCIQKGLESHMNRIDMGIALAHLYVANEETFRFFKAENAPDVPGYGYIGSVTL